MTSKPSTKTSPKIGGMQSPPNLGLVAAAAAGGLRSRGMTASGATNQNQPIQHTVSMAQLPTQHQGHFARPPPPRSTSPPAGIGLAGRPPPPPSSFASRPPNQSQNQNNQQRRGNQTSPANASETQDPEVESKIRELTSRLASLEKSQQAAIQERQQAENALTGNEDDPYAQGPPQPQQQQQMDDEYGENVPVTPPQITPRFQQNPQISPKNPQQQQQQFPSQLRNSSGSFGSNGSSAGNSPVVKMASPPGPAVAPIILPETNFGDDPSAFWDPSQLDDVSQQIPSIPSNQQQQPMEDEDVNNNNNGYNNINQQQTPQTTSQISPLQQTSSSSPITPHKSQFTGSMSSLPTLSQQENEMPDTVVNLEDCPVENLVALLCGSEEINDEDIARKARARAPDMRQLHVVICGSSISGKALWLVRSLGYACARRPDADLLHRRVKHDGKIYLLSFTITDDSFAFAEAAYRWGDAFVLVGDVYNRDSFEAVKQFHSNAIREREVPTLPMILVMSHNPQQAEETWKVSRAEVASLSETLNVPLCDVSSAATAEGSIHTLINEVRKLELGIGTDKKQQQRTLQQQQQQQQLQQQQSGPVMTELEFVVLGDSFVGKTSLISRAFGDAFATNYSATTTKSIRKQVMKLNGDGYVIKLVDSPGFFLEQAMRECAAGTSAVENASEMAIQWLQQQSLISAHGFMILFSVTSRESFQFAQELVNRIQVALVDAPGSRNQVKLLLGTKTDQVHMRTVGDAEIAEAAQRLGTLHATTSMKSAEKEPFKVIFERLIGALYGRNAGSLSPLTLSSGGSTPVGTPILHASSPSGLSGISSMNPNSSSPLSARHAPERTGSTLSAKELRKQQEKQEKLARKERERLEKEAKDKAKKAGKK